MNDVFVKLGSLLSVMCRHRSPVQLWYCESLEKDSGGRIIEVLLGTEFSGYDRRTSDNYTRPKQLVQTVRTESRSNGQFGSLFFTPRMTL